MAPSRESAASPEPERVRRAKVVVLGRGEAGKSTLIGALCERPLNLEVRGRTVAMDHGMLRHDGYSLSLVGVPGQQRFSGVRSALSTGATAAIWVVRAPDGPDDESARLLVELARPYLMVLNHQRDEAPPRLAAFHTLLSPVPPAEVIACDLLRGRERGVPEIREALIRLLRDAIP